MNFMSISLIFFISKVSCSEIIYSVEGEPVHFNFSYPCNSSEVTVQFANGDPFYRSTSPLQDLKRGWINTKIDKLMVKKFRLHSQCGIKVWLNPVMKIHTGTYIRFSYKNDGSPPEMKRIGLRVDLLPGKASCKLSKEDTDNTDGELVSLRCTASVGDVPGHIQCFQNGVNMSALTPRTENDQVFQQTFLVSPTHPAHCCSLTVEQPKSMCECRDTLWNPSHKEGVIDHCQDTLTPSQTIREDILISTPIGLSTVYTTNAPKGKNLSVYLLVLSVPLACFFVLGIIVRVILRVFLARSKRGNQDAEAEANSPSLKPLVQSEPQNTDNESDLKSNPPVALEMVKLETANK